MRLSLIQTTLHWEQPDKNRRMLAETLAPLAGQTDIAILPEMFSTGFSMNTSKLAEPADGPTLAWMRAQAEALGAVVTGSFICTEDGRNFNRLAWMQPDGQFFTYDKKHLFGLAGENQHYSPGNKRLMVEWKGWRICPLICYDLRFPVWSRNRPDDAYDLLIYVANWPERRVHHWRSLLTARAIENQAFTAGVNIFGSDGTGLNYTGDSAVIDFWGLPKLPFFSGNKTETVELSMEELKQYRAQLPFLNDADLFQLR